MESLEGRNRDEDDNGLATVANLDLEESWCQRCVAVQCPPPLRLYFIFFCVPSFPTWVKCLCADGRMVVDKVANRRPWYCLSSSYLAGGDELQRPEGAAHVWDVALELEESIGNVGLDLRGVLARRAVRRNLVEGLGGHSGGYCRRERRDSGGDVQRSRVDFSQSTSSGCEKVCGRPNFASEDRQQPPRMPSHDSRR